MKIEELYPTDSELIRPPRYTDEEFGQAVKLLQEHHSYADSVELAQRIASTKLAVDHAVKKIVEYLKTNNQFPYNAVTGEKRPDCPDAGLGVSNEHWQALKELIK